MVDEARWAEDGGPAALVPASAARFVAGDVDSVRSESAARFSDREIAAVAS
jgi:hypothetical protein